MVRAQVGQNVEIAVTPTNDHRSYHVSSTRIHNELGFTARRTVEDAILDLKQCVRSRQSPELDDR